MRWDPWGELAELQQDVNQIFSRAFGQPTRRATTLVPPIDAYLVDTGMVVRIELPGVRPADVDISVAERELTVSGERRLDEQIEADRWVRRERAYGPFQRSFTLPEGTDPDNITAAFEHGVLELTIPHPPERQPRKIAVSSTPASQQTVDVS